jgi:hypothetical protein
MSSKILSINFVCGVIKITLNKKTRKDVQIKFYNKCLRRVSWMSNEGEENSNSEMRFVRHVGGWGFRTTTKRRKIKHF